MVLVGVSFSMLMYYSERIMRLKIRLEVKSSAILDLIGSNQFLSYPMAVILLKVVPCPLPSCFIPPSEILLPYSYGRQRGEGPSSVTASRLSRGIDPACQGVKIRGCLI